MDRLLVFGGNFKQVADFIFEHNLNTELIKHQPYNIDILMCYDLNFDFEYIFLGDKKNITKEFILKLKSGGGKLINVDELQKYKLNAKSPTASNQF